MIKQCCGFAVLMVPNGVPLGHADCPPCQAHPNRLCNRPPPHIAEWIERLIAKGDRIPDPQQEAPMAAEIQLARPKTQIAFKPTSDLGAIFSGLLGEAEAEQLSLEQCKERFPRHYNDFAQRGEAWTPCRDANYLEYRRVAMRALDEYADLRAERELEALDVENNRVRVRHPDGSITGWRWPARMPFWPFFLVALVLKGTFGTPFIFFPMAVLVALYRAALVPGLRGIRHLRLRSRFAGQLRELLGRVDLEGDRLLPVPQGSSDP